MGRSLHKTLTALVISLALVALGGCGGSDETATRSSAPPPKAPAKEEVEVGPLDMSPATSVTYRTGHHTNVPVFGKQASERELRQAATDVHDYVAARVEGDWPRACAYVSDGLVRRLSARSKQDDETDCATLLAELQVPGTGGSDYESSTVEVEDLRIKGERGYFLYAAAAAPFFTPVVNEGGAWKVDALVGTSFYD